MRTSARILALGTAITSAALITSAAAGSSALAARKTGTKRTEVAHVLLISIDGLHQYDVQQWIRLSWRTKLAPAAAGA